MPTFHKMDMDTWPRREHYQYYTEKLKIECSATVNIEVNALLDFCHKNGYKFYASLIAVVTKVLNSIENFRMFTDQDGHLCVWDHIVPSYTIFHDDDKTFSDCWSEYSDSFEELYHSLVEDMKRFAAHKGIKARDHQPPNFFCISGDPWTHFTAFNSRVTNGNPQYFPIITCGRYTEEQGKMLMPVNVMIAHAVCDGYHVGLFFKLLQQEINNLS